MTIQKCLVCFIFILSVLLHREIFTKDLIGKHLWRQAQTQLNIQNFTRNDFNILNPRTNSWNGNSSILRLEFPIMQWTIASLNKIFGESIFITRLFMFLTGIFGALGFYLLLYELLEDRWSSLIGAYLLTYSPVFYFYTMNPQPDIFGLSMGIWSFYFFFKYKNKNFKNSYLILSAIFISISILAKLPFIIFGIIPSIFFIQNLLGKNEKKHIISVSLVIAYGISLVGPVLWYSWVMKSWGNDTTIGGIVNHPISWDRFSYILKHHFEVMWPRQLIGYPALILLLIGLFYAFKKKVYKNKNFILIVSFAIGLMAYFFYEISIIDVVHDYYMLPFFPLFFLVVAYGTKSILKKKIGKALVLIVFIAAPFHAYLSVNNWWSRYMSFFDMALLEDRDFLRNFIPQDSKCIMLNDYSGCMTSYLIDKQGYTFNNDQLPTLWVDDMIKNYNTTYLFSTSRAVDTREDLQPYLDSVIYEKIHLRVFKLKNPQLTE